MQIPIKKIGFLNFFLIITLLFATASYANTKTIILSVVKDVGISAHPDEEDLNMGAALKLKLKGIQEMVLLDFDLSPLKGKGIESAKLYLCNVKKKNKLRKIGISTVASPWVEGKSRGYISDVIGKGATFFYSSYKKQRWAGNGSDLTDVTMGSGNTWQYHTELQKEEGMWWSVDIAPRLIQAIIANKSYGLLIMDESGQTLVNNYIFSRESKHSSPYIVITVSDIQKKRPQKLDVELSASFQNAHMEFGAVVLRIPIKEDVLAFDVYINDEVVPLWKVPKPDSANTVQEIIIDWLPPEKKVDIKIMAVDQYGQRSEPAFISGYSSRSLPRINIPVYESNNEIEQNILATSEDNSLRVWAVPELTKIDPTSGQMLSESNSIDFNKINPIWSEDRNEIMLLSARGEVVGFQLVVETDSQLLDKLKIKMSHLVKNPDEMIFTDQFSLYQVHYLKVKDSWFPELLIPMYDGNVTRKAAEIPMKNQKNQLIYIDLSIPSEIEAGVYRGKLSILQEGFVVESLKMKLKVADVLMPERLTFIPELNMYKGPGKVGADRFYQAHRIAHEHRCVINRVPYSQNGKVHIDMIPQITYTEEDKIEIDWSDYDRRLGPLFDGSAFTSGGRKGIPVEKFYLPFFENWPTALASNYQYEYVQNKTRKAITKHALESPPLDESLTPEYKERFIKVVKRFIKHFEEKGWDQTEFQFYLNNKWKWKNASSWWNLDEPMSYDDWMALRFFGSLFNCAKGSTSIPIIFRADISRPRWQHDWLNGILERMYVQNKVFFRYSDHIRQLKTEGQINFSIYGSLNEIELSNQQTVLWCMRAFVEGADGVLPWQSLGGTSAFSSPDKNALLVDARKVLGIDWVVSLRVKALRRGQQNVELLAMLENKYGYNREQIRGFFYRYFDKGKVTCEGSMDEDSVSEISTHKMENFRKILIDMLVMD